MRLQISYKDLDQKGAYTMCFKAREFLSRNVINGKGPECAAPLLMTKASVGLFGGLGSANPAFSNITAQFEKPFMSNELVAIYAALEAAGGMSALADFVQYPSAWRVSCCNMPPFRLTDSCGVDVALYGDWAYDCKATCLGM